MSEHTAEGDVARLTDKEIELREWLRSQPGGAERWTVVKAGFRRSYDMGMRDSLNTRPDAESDVPACDCDSMGGRFGSHRPECPWRVAFEAQLAADYDAGWPCDDYRAPLTCYTVPNGPKHLTCGGCRQAFPNGPEVQRLYRWAGLTDPERLSLAEQVRIAFDTPPEQRVIQDTWLYAAAMAEQWYVDRANTSVTSPGESER